MLFIPLTANSISAIGDPNNAGHAAQTIRIKTFTWAAQKGTSTGFRWIWVSVLPIPPCQPPPAYFPSSQPMTYFFTYIIAKMNADVKHRHGFRYLFGDIALKQAD